ncbi:MAG: hypothetical protein M3Y86_03930, partial [Verrucomicrobiota bacterium]|nr:hypothetical protein [Verrucomicrobiota bacterium]
MKTKDLRFSDRACGCRLPLLAAVLGFLTLLPFRPAAAQVANVRALNGREIRSSNGDLLPTPEEAATPVSGLSMPGSRRDWWLTDFERRSDRQISPSATTGVSTWIGGIGNWSNGAMWNPIDPPNSGGADVFVDGGNTGTASAVTVDGTFTIGRLTIDAGDSVTVSNSNDFRVATGAFTGSGNIVNNGSFNLNTTGNTTRLFLTGNGGLTLSGTGTMTMSGGTANQITADTFNALFTNQSTIQGIGNIGVNIIDVNNRGLIDANVTLSGSNSLYLDANATFTNSGTLRASNGGLLQLGASNYANAGGTILATGTGSVVQLETNAVISGGTLSTAGGGLVQSAAGASATLIGVTNTGAYQGTNNSDTFLQGTITNSGTITLNSAGNNTRLMLNSSGATLAGGGSVILGGAGLNQISGNVFNALLTNQANTISGVGNIGANIIDLNNQSLIDANVPFTGANLLLIDANATVTNTGTLRASNGGLLDLGGGSYLNAGGTILATGTGSIVQLDNGAGVSGGTLATSGGGIIQTAPGISAGLDNLSNTGNYLMSNNSDTRISGTITNSGTMTLRAAGNAVRLI